MDKIFESFLGVEVKRTEENKVSTSVYSSSQKKTIFSPEEHERLQEILGCSDTNFNQKSSSCYRQEKKAPSTCLPCQPVISPKPTARHRSSDEEMKTKAYESSNRLIQSFKCKSNCTEGQKCIENATFAETSALLEDFWGVVIFFMHMISFN
jgi:hypothetical protein